MLRVTLLEAKNSRIPNAIGTCATEPKFIAILNEARERLIKRGKWHGTVQRVRICAVNGCITLPTQIAAIESVAVCGMPVVIRDFWYEFLENGPGLSGGGDSHSEDSDSDGSCCGHGACGPNAAIYRGQYPTFDDIRGVDKKVKLICDLVSDVGKQVLVLGYDNNLNWVRTDQGGTILDGEIVTLAQGAGTISTNFFTTVTGMQFPSTMDGQTWMYEYNTTDTTVRLIGTYQYFDTRPSFSRYLFPGVRATADSDDVCQRVPIDAVVKLAYLPVVKDTDYLVVEDIPALKAMCVAINNSEKVPDTIEKAKIIAAGYAEALSELNSQADHLTGTGRRIGITILGSSIGALDPIPNMQ